MTPAPSTSGALPRSERFRLRRLDWLLAVIAAAVAFAVFAPTLNNDFVDWDDPGVLLDNPDYRGLGPEQIKWMFTTNHYGHYQPITWLTYGLDYVLWEMDPTGYHLTNNLFHAANALLMYFLALGLLRRGLRSDAASVSIAALAAALLFAVHPLRVESVAWATERRDLVSAFFLLLTMLCYLRATAAARLSVPWFVVTLLVYALSMISKVGGAPLPVVLLVLDWYPLRRLEGGRSRIVRVLLEKIPFFVIAVGFAISTIAQQTNRWLMPLSDHDLLARTAQAFYGLVFYAWKTFLPTGLSPLYELRVPLNPFAPRFIASAAIVIVGFVAMVIAARRWRGPLAAALCYAFMLGPLLGYFQNGPQVVADRYSYLSTAGWVILAVGAAHALAMRGAGLRRAVVAAGVVAVLALSIMTWRQSNVWKDTGTLWLAILESDPESSFANNSFGCVLLEEDRMVEALPHFRKAIAINPKNQRAYYNLWGTLRELGRTGELEAAYREAVNAPLLEVRADTRYRLGTIALRAERNEEAIEMFRYALSSREGHAQTHNNLAMVLARLDDDETALKHYRRAAQLEPTLPNPWYGIARMCDRLGQYDAALEALDVLKQLQPDNANAPALRAQVEARKRG